MRDANLIFHDGTNITGTVTPVSTTRASGSAVLDVGKSGVDGFYVQAALEEAIVGASGTLAIKIQYSDSATFASGIEDGPSFPTLNNTAFPASIPWRRSLLCQTKRRYARALITGGGTLTTNKLHISLVSGPDRDDTA